MSDGSNKKACLDTEYTGNIGYIEEVLAGILCRVPGKQVADHKFVCKFWRKLIGEQQFAHLHFSCSSEQKYIIFTYNVRTDDDTDIRIKLYLMDKDKKISPYVTLPSVGRNSFLKLICSFNGLLCFTKSLGGNDLDIYICNPATQEILKLPRGSPSTKPPSIGVIFEPNKIKYKVVRFFTDGALKSEDSTATKCEIYIPGDGNVNWRVIDGVVRPPLPNVACPLFPTNICVGGRIYWLVWKESSAKYILSMDMDEKITRIELPPVIHDGPPEELDELDIYNMFTFLIEYKGRLRLVSVDDDEYGFTMWSLKNPQESAWGNAKGVEFDEEEEEDNSYPMNSIVSRKNKILFVSSQHPDIFRFLKKGTWEVPEFDSMCEGCPEFRDILDNIEAGKCEIVVFPFSESLFRCDASYRQRRAHDFW